MEDVCHFCGFIMQQYIAKEIIEEDVNYIVCPKCYFEYRGSKKGTKRGLI